MTSDHEDVPGIREAFENLHGQTSHLDTMAARRAVENRRHPRPVAGVLGVAAALLVVLGAVIVGVAVLGDDGEQVTTDDVAGPDVGDRGRTEGPLTGLAGASWTLVSGVGPSGDIQLVDGWPITLTFETEAGSITGTAACNGYGGAFELAGASLTVGELSATAMACEPASVMRAESAYLAALQDVNRVDIGDDGRLVLEGPATELRFDRLEPVPTADLVGQLWLLDTLIDGDTASTVRGEPATLLLGADGTMTGATGCRTLSGEYVITGASVLLTSFAADGDCPSELAGQDGFVVSVLGDGFTVEIVGDRLTVTSRGNEALGFRAVDEDDVDGLEPDDTTSDAALLGAGGWVFAGGDSPEGPIDDPRTIDMAASGAELFFEGDVPSISLEFDGPSIAGLAICNRYGTDVSVDGSAITIGAEVGGIESEEEGCGDPFDEITRRYFDALLNVSQLALDNGGRILVLTGAATELVFERAGEVTEPVSVDELLGSRPAGAVEVVGHLVRRDGGWVICDRLDEAIDPPGCAFRWTVVTNYDAALGLEAEPGGSMEQAALDLVDLDDAFVGAGGVVWTPEPVTVTLMLLEDGRAADPAHPSGVDPTVDEVTLFEAWGAVDTSAGSVDISGLRISDDGLRLGLTDDLLVTRFAAELIDPVNWFVDLDQFRARVGPFSAVELLSAADELQLVVGTHDHCASPPAAVHADLRERRHLSIQPVGIDSCLDWFTVDLYLDDAGEVVAVTLDLWEP